MADATLKTNKQTNDKLRPLAAHLFLVHVNIISAYLSVLVGMMGLASLL